MPNEIQRIYWGSQSSPVAAADLEEGTFTITFDGQDAYLNPYDVSAATLQMTLESLSTIGSGNVSVTATSNGFTVEFIGSLANTNVNLLSISGSTVKKRADTVSVNVIQAGAFDSYASCSLNQDSFTDGDGSSTPAQQVISCSPAAMAGSWTFNGASYQYYETPFDPTDWTVSGSALSGTITITRNDNNSGQSAFSFSNDSLEYMTTGQPDIVDVWLPDDPDEGKLYLFSWYGNTASPEWFYNDAASTVQTAVGAVYSSTVSGLGTTASPWRVTTDTNAAPDWAGYEGTMDPLRASVGSEVVVTQAGGSGGTARPFLRRRTRTFRRAF